MLKNVHIKITKTSSKMGPFDIYDQFGNLIAEDVSLKQLIEGIGYILDESVTMIKLVSTGDCPAEKIMPITVMTEKEFYYDTTTEIVQTTCLWRHLTNPVIYNYFYGVTDPYVIEYPFAYQYNDQILQSIQSYSRVYRYDLPDYDKETPLTPDKVELDDEWFNKAIIYNGQECTGLLELEPKPANNLKSYLSYPKYNEGSKTILYDKGDSFYQYNDFWNVVSDRTKQIFVPSCDTLSIDKELNQSNMDYGYKSFSKAPIRGKESKVRHILDNKNDIHIVSRLLFQSTQISY